MNFKKLFSFPRKKKMQKRVLDQLQQPDSQVDASQVAGGQQSGFGWIKSEASDDPKR